MEFFSSDLQSVLQQSGERHLPRTVFRYREAHSLLCWPSLVTRKESSSRVITLMLFNITLKTRVYRRQKYKSRTSRFRQ